MKLFAAILAFSLWSLSPSPSMAETKTVRVGVCRTKTADFSLYLEAGKKLVDGAQLQVMSSQISPTSGLNLSTAGTLNAEAKRIELRHWTPRALNFDECALDEIQKPAPPRFSAVLSATPKPLPVDHLMYVQVYFVHGDPRPDIDIDDLYKRGQAIPLKAKIICSSIEEDPTVTSCTRIIVLDEIIPLGTATRKREFAASLSLAGLSSVVAIESGPCAEPAKRVRSTGFVIAHDGRAVLVTSSGAVFPGTTGCTDAITSTGKKPLTLARFDLASGLAAFDASALGLAPATLSTEPLGDVADVYGFSKAGGDAIKKTLRVLSESSTRHFIPAISRTIELQGQIIDSGFVGAPAVSASGQVIGLVSHQYLRIHPGSLTRPTRWQPFDKEAADHVVTIPAVEIQKWLASPARATELEIARDARLGSALSLKSGHLAFEEDCPPLDATKPSQDYPIGGGDPVGIGGDASNYRACRIKVTLSESGSTKFFAPAFQAWHDETVELLKNADVDFAELIFAVNRDEKSRLTRRYFYSVESFFQELSSRPTDRAVTVLRRRSTKSTGIDPRLESLRAQALAAAASARSVYTNFETTDTKLTALVRRIYFLGTLAQSEQWSMLNEADFTEYLDLNGTYRHPWQVIIAYALGGKGLRTATEKLHAEWQKAPK